MKMEAMRRVERINVMTSACGVVTFAKKRKVAFVLLLMVLAAMLMCSVVAWAKLSARAYSCNAIHGIWSSRNPRYLRNSDYDAYLPWTVSVQNGLPFSLHRSVNRQLSPFDRICSIESGPDSDSISFETCVSAIRNFRELKRVHLDWMKCKDANVQVGPAYFPSLSTVTLSYTKCGKSFALWFVDASPELRVLNVTGCGILDTSFVERISSTRVSTLCLKDNILESVTAGKVEIASVEHLDISGVANASSVMKAFRFPGLRTLVCKDTTIDSDALSFVISCSNGLELIDLSGSASVDIGWSALSGLRGAATILLNCKSMTAGEVVRVVHGGGGRRWVLSSCSEDVRMYLEAATEGVVAGAFSINGTDDCIVIDFEGK